MNRVAFFAFVAAVFAVTSLAVAHEVGFKSPNPGMHFTKGQPLVVFADIFDSRDGKGFIVCPNGETISNTTPPPDYSDPGRTATCSGGSTPTGWPQFQLFIDTVQQTDLDTGLTQIPHTIAFDHNINPSPIGTFRFVADTSGLSVGPHQLIVHAFFSNDGVNIEELDGDPLTIQIDAPPAKTVTTLDADLSGPVHWDNVLVVGNGHAVDASGDLVITNSLVTGISGLSGSIDGASIQGSIFEDSGELNLTLGAGAATIKDNEFRANNRLEFVASDPGVPFILELHGGSGTKVFQGNRVGAGQLRFAGSDWFVGGDTDAESNILIGPRSVLNVDGSNITIRGNYSHHNYRGAWSQGFNFYYMNAGSGVLTEHNFIRDSSWPVQSVAGEFRYNVVYGYGHTWIRTAKGNASIHHNLFAPGGDGGLNSGIQCYGGESGLVVYNNTFDGGGAALGDFAGPTIDMSGGSTVTSLRNNLITFSRDQQNGPGSVRVTGGAAAYTYADYNAFYSPDNTTKTAYDFTAGADDAADGANGQLSGTPFAGVRILTDSNRIIDGIIDEGAVWQRTQKLSQVLALFRARYMPKAGSAIIDAGDPADNDSQGRRTDIGAIDLDGHDQDKLGKFGTPPAELVPPTVTLTAPASGDTLTGSVTLSADATDNTGGTGVVLVEFLVDGGTVAQTATSPYSVSFNSATVPNGDHDFWAKAWDAAGNSAVSAVVTARTDNAVIVPPGGGGGGGASAAGGSNAGGAGGANGGGKKSSGCSCRLAHSERHDAWLALGIVVAVLLRRRGRCASSRQLEPLP